MKKTAWGIIVCQVIILFSVLGFAQNADVDKEIKAIQEKIDREGLGWEAGYNKIMDLPLEERHRMLGLVIPDSVKQIYDTLTCRIPQLTTTEAVFDWRLLGGVTPVKDQGGCGSCWAFAATAGFESAYLISTGQEMDFSEQAIVSCDQNSDGCEGGWCGSAYDHFAYFGAVDETCMPYQADDSVPCTEDQCDVLAYLDGYQPLPNSVDAIKAYLAIGPVSTSYTVYDDFYAYQRGCYEHADTQPTNHAVLIVGWDDNECNGEGAWICKNSWGPGFGRLGGYFYIKYGSAAIGSASIIPYYNVDGVAEMNYSPDSYEIYLDYDYETSENLYISNVGDADLRYYIEPFSVTNQDAFGYSWKDSDAPDGPDYDWVDITHVGQVIDFGDMQNDGNSGQLDLGFDFEYYGETQTHINICTNGWASFSNMALLEWENRPIPDWYTPNNLLAAFFDNLDLEYGGDIYYYTNNSDSAVITWNEVPDDRQEGVFTFQIILVAPDKVVYQYSSMGPGRLDECTIGIENRNGTIGSQVAYNEPYVHSNLAIEFLLGDAPPPMTWIIPDPQSGVVAPGEQQTVQITFDATDVPEGIHEGVINIMNTSMESPVVQIPVTLYYMPMTDIDNSDARLPRQLMITSLYPNPFNPSTAISYSVPVAGHITVEAYNLLGQKVATLFDDNQDAGYHTLNWQPENLSSGIYLVKLSDGTRSETRRVTLLK